MLIKKLLSTIMLIGCVLSCSPELSAQSQFHVSAMVNYEIVNGYRPGWDLTLLYNNQWGARYTNISNVLYLETKDENEDSVSLTKISGDFKLPMVLKTVDYSAFSGSNKTIFDFITAYYGLGYNSYNIKESHETYTAESDNLNKEKESKLIDVDMMAAVLGIYGGERFLVIDSRVIYYRGQTGDSKLSGQNHRFEDWLFVVSVGIGF